jgi:hypothetical protein
VPPVESGGYFLRSGGGISDNGTRARGVGRASFIAGYSLGFQSQIPDRFLNPRGTLSAARAFASHEDDYGHD